MYQVQITDQAVQDMQETAAYIRTTLHNPAAAMHLLDEAEQSLYSLSDFPYRNPLVKDAFLATNGIRIQIINNYLAVYTIREQTKTAVILRFLHCRRDWMSILKSDD